MEAVLREKKKGITFKRLRGSGGRIERVSSPVINAVFAPINLLVIYNLEAGEVRSDHSKGKMMLNVW